MVTDAQKVDEKLPFPSDRNTRPVVSSEEALPYLSHIRYRKQEHVVCVAIDSRMCVISRKTIFIGSLNSSVVHPREIFIYALKKSAAAIIISHNHPSGECVPSNADIEVTQQLVAAGDVLGIEVLDHIIVGRDDHFSFSDKGFLLDYGEKIKLKMAIH